MLEVLNMRLQVLRTVLKNRVNEVSVCADLKRDSGTFYTLVSITDDAIRRELAMRVGSDALFTANRDFVGSFTYQDSLGLVFVYRPENRLADREPLLAGSFAQRKRLASGLLVACAEAGAAGPVGELLLEDRNIHVSQDGRVYFNYFLDFQNYRGDQPAQNFYAQVADRAFALLSRDYSQRYGQRVDHYPQELQAFYKKKQRMGFTSFNQILTSIQLIPDQPQEQHFGLLRLWDRLRSAGSWVARHSMAIFIVSLVTATVVYASWQIYQRSTIKKDREVNTSYAGMEQIGEVYLGDEDV